MKEVFPSISMLDESVFEEERFDAVAHCSLSFYEKIITMMLIRILRKSGILDNLLNVQVFWSFSLIFFDFLEL